MKKSIFTRAGAVVLTVLCCFAIARPVLADVPADASAPLSGLAIDANKAYNPEDSMAAYYELAPTFQPNTQVYTVKCYNGAAIPTSADEAVAITIPSVADGTTYAHAYDSKTQLLTLTTTKGADSTVYYVSFTDIAEASKSDTANINVKKILRADENAVLDALSFTYELFPVKIVENTAPVSVTEIPLANVLNDADDTNGLVNITTGASKSEMVMSKWESAPKISDEDLAALGADYTDKPVQNGTFSITYTSVGQYVYLLHEVKGTATGVTYDEDWYEVIVSAVHSDPSNPESPVVIGWIEVNLVKDYVSNSEYGIDSKVNFGTNTVIDGEKYDNATTAITYPFVNILATEDLVVNKTVTGDLGDKDQEFLFEITVTGTNLAENYAISYTDGMTTSQMPTNITTTNATTGTAYITLKHGMTVTIAELPVGMEYTVTEIAVANENLSSATEAANYNTSITYDKSLNDSGDVVKELAVSKTVTAQALLDTKLEITGDKNFVTVVNDKPLTPPTGAFLDMIPYIAMVIVAAVGLTFFSVARHRRAYDAD